MSNLPNKANPFLLFLMGMVLFGPQEFRDFAIAVVMTWPTVCMSSFISEALTAGL